MEKLVIIGGGPAGLAAAIYAGRGLLNPVLVEGIEPGGQLMKTSEVDNYPGFPKGVLGVDLMKHMREQAERFNTKFISQNVSGIEKKNDIFVINFDDGKSLESETVLIATGAKSNWLGLKSEQRLIGSGVSSCATCDGFFFKDKKVVVIGGGDAAMEEADFLTKYASKVILIHRRDKFRASKIMQERIFKNEKVEIMFNKEVIEILGQDSVSGIKIKDTQSNKEETLEIDGVFLAIGHTPSTDFLAATGVLMDAKKYIYTTERVMFEQVNEIKDKFFPEFRYQTNVKGLFAAGDCVDHAYRQAGTAVGMGIAAQLEIEKYLTEKNN